MSISFAVPRPIEEINSSLTKEIYGPPAMSCVTKQS